VDHVGFSYPIRPEAVLKDVTLTLNAGEIVGLLARADRVKVPWPS
ncbi:multidrug ABC transporter ATPase and permease, partial [Lacticaseibacillus rhamnosus MTCC 5462]